MKSVIILNHDSMSVRSGATLATIGQAEALVDAGYRVVFVRSGGGTIDPTITSRLEKKSITPVTLNIPYWPALWHNADPDETLAAGIVSILCDLIHQTQASAVVSSTLVRPWGALAAAYANCPHIWMAHEYISPISDTTWLDQYIDFIFESSIVVLASSQTLKDELGSKKPNAASSARLEVCTPYVDISPVALQPASSQPRLICPNHFTPVKNQIEFLQGLVEIVTRGYTPSVLFSATVVGDKRYYASVVSFISDHVELQPLVHFQLGATSNWDFVRTSDVVVLTSQEETFGMTTMESLKLGLPLVISDMGSLEMQRLGYVTPVNTYPLGQPTLLATRILDTIETLPDRREHSRQIQIRVLREQSAETCSKPLLEWLSFVSKGSSRKIGHGVSSLGLRLRSLLEDKKSN